MDEVCSDTSFDLSRLYLALVLCRSHVHVIHTSYLKEYGIDVLVYEPGATRTSVVRSSKTGVHTVPGDKTQQYMPTFMDMLDKRMADGMPAEDVAEDIFNLVKQLH